MHYLLPQDRCPFEAHPFRCHHWAQEEIAWGFRDGPAEMSVPSAMGRMLEGGVRQVGADILEDPMLALEQAKARVEAAELFRMFAQAIRSVGPLRSGVLEKVYGEPVAETDLLAFGGAANLFLESPVAHQYHQRQRRKIGFIAWAGELRVHLAGERYEDPRVAGRFLRRPSRASEAEKTAAEEIRRSMEKTLLDALSAYAMARPRR
jgi:hypothetical protein